MRASQQQKEIDARPSFWDRVGERALGQIGGGLVDAGGALIKDYMPSAKQKRAIEKAAEARADDLHMMKTEGPVWQSERLMELIRQGKVSREEARKAGITDAAFNAASINPALGGQAVPSYADPGTALESKLYAGGMYEGPGSRDLDPNAVLSYLHSPGSTGRPVGSMITSGPGHVPPLVAEAAEKRVGGRVQADPYPGLTALSGYDKKIKSLLNRGDDPDMSPTDLSWYDKKIKGLLDQGDATAVDAEISRLIKQGDAFTKRESEAELEAQITGLGTKGMGGVPGPLGTTVYESEDFGPAMKGLDALEAEVKALEAAGKRPPPHISGGGRVGVDPDMSRTDLGGYDRKIDALLDKAIALEDVPRRTRGGMDQQARRTMEKVAAPRTALDKATKKLEKEVAKTEKPKSFRQQWKEHSRRLGELQYYKQVAAQKAAEQEFTWKTKPAAIKSLSEAISKMDPKGRKGRVLRRFVVDLDNYDDARSPADIFKKAGAKVISLYGGGTRHSGNAAKKWLDGYVYSKKTERAHWAALAAKELGVTVDGLYPMVKTAEGHSTVMNAFSKVKELTGAETAIAKGLLAELSRKHSYWLKRFGKETDIKKLMEQGAFENAIGVQEYIAAQKRRGVGFKMSMEALIESKVVKLQPGSASGGEVSYHLRDTQGRLIKFSPAPDWQSTVTNAIPTGQGEVPKPKPSTYNNTTPISGPVTSADLEKYGSKMKARFNSKRNNQMLSLGPREYLDILMSEGGMNRVQAARKTKEAFAAQVRKLRAGK
jgi:hypothetical protein